MAIYHQLSTAGLNTIQEPGANAGENPAANLNALVGSSSNFEDIPAILSVSAMAMFRQLTDHFGLGDLKTHDFDSGLSCTTLIPCSFSSLSSSAVSIAGTYFARILYLAPGLSNASSEWTS